MTRSDIIREKTVEVCNELLMEDLASLRGAANELYDRTFKALAEMNEVTAAAYAARGDITPWQAAALIRCSIGDHLPEVMGELAERKADRIDAVLDRLDEAEIDLSEIDLSEIDPDPKIAMRIVRTRHMMRKQQIAVAATIIIDALCCGFTLKERKATLAYLRGMAFVGALNTMSESEFFPKSVPDSMLVKECLSE